MRIQRGFTLLEAIVALVLLSTIGLALFSWINNDLENLHRVDDANARNRATRNILEYMNTVNPMIAPSGKSKLGDYDFSWRAKELTAVVDNSDYPQGTGLYQFALYQTHLQVKKGNVLWFEFDLRQTGYKRVRELKVPF